MQQKHTLSVNIVTKNEQEQIKACLEAIKWADEIIVLDSGSTDNTIKIAKEYTDKVFVTDWPGIGAQKNRAIAKTNCDWVLALDADEVVTPSLATEIQQAIKQNQYSAYSIPFKSKYCGKFIKHGAWHNEKHIRLFQRTKGHFSEDIIHAELKIQGSIGKLKHAIVHNSFKNLEEVLEKVNLYSSDGAKLRIQQGKKATLKKAIIHAFWAFIKSYAIQLGFLDGREGFMLAFSNAEGAYYRYAKMLYLQNKD